VIINFTGWQAPYPRVGSIPANKKLFTPAAKNKSADNRLRRQITPTWQVIRRSQATVLLDAKERPSSPRSGPNAKRLGNSAGQEGMNCPSGGGCFVM